MLARHLPELIDLQKKHNVALLYDASSCGSIPVIRNLEEYYDNDLLLEVKGILNGSSNYILSRVFDHQESYDAALAQAQALGFAESDPSLRLALQISHHYRSRARSVCPSRPDLHLRHLDYPRLGHPVRPRKRGQDQTGRPSGQGQRPEVHDVRHARIRHPRQIHLQRR